MGGGGRGENLLTLTQGAEPPSTYSPSIFASASWTLSILCWPLAQPPCQKGFLNDRPGGSGYPASNPQLIPHLLPPKLKPHKDDPDNCFAVLCWGCCGGRKPGDLRWDLLTWQDSLCLKNSQVGYSRPEQCPHSGSWGLAGPHWEEQALRWGPQPSSGKQYR